MKIIKKKIRLIRRINFINSRLFLYRVFRLWLRKIHSIEKLPESGPCIIVSNHTSYVDWIILSAIYKKKYLVFIGNSDLNNRPIVSWLMKLNILIYINTNNPGYSYFREVIRRLNQGHIVVIYPEGTRSRTGEMLEPKVGFVKLAMIANVPIFPIGLKGAYEILPPSSKIPKFKRCDVYLGSSFKIDSENKLFKDILNTSDMKNVSKETMQEIAFRIMELIRSMVGQKWVTSVNWVPCLYFLEQKNTYLNKNSLPNK